MRISVLFLLPILLAGPCFGQKKETLEMQRDISLLQNEVRAMKSAMDEKFAAITVLTQQALDGTNKTNTALAVMDKTLNDRLQAQQSSLNAPLAGVNTKIDQMTTEFALMKESVSELSELVKKLQTQLTDVSNTIRTLNTPPPAPAPAPAAPTAPSGPPAGVTAESLFTSAVTSKSGGLLDLALSQFSDYLKWYPTTSYAPNAQFSVGEILFKQEKFDEAVKAFDAVIESYPDSGPKVLDAQLAKGRSLAKSGQRTAAASEFRNLIKKNEMSRQATDAKAELKALGLPYAAPSAATRKTRK
jgi:TolA-binding protein